MSWRDRTNLFISYRQSYPHHPSKRSPYVSGVGPDGRRSTNLEEERRGLIADAAREEGDAIIEMGVLPPRWADIQDQVTDLLEGVQRKMKQLDPLHAKHVLPGFEDDRVKLREEREIEAMTQDITRDFQACQSKIKRVAALIKQEKQKPSGISRAEEVMAHNLQISMATKVGDVSATFRKKQSVYLKKMRTLSGMSADIDRSSTSTPTLRAKDPYNDPSMAESEADRRLSQVTMQQTAQKKRQNNDSTIAQREKEIEDIAQGIIELANIFSELQNMVIDQGTMLDRIDYNIERMNTDVKAADKELKTATNYQRKSAKRKIILLLILVIVGLVILLGLKLRG